ncbi:hypothetical protein [Erythrobacter dokdonensis]|uniref:Two component LuxR family transcriptional regulator n=1 Tax=Erythrobacter dokdonensis DSW-74 TaxID=1300349 RepID=A0A1A7BEZ6_9SPHN|nr:hypothetical protein [Erythrobacter dokdonensis]OBV09962.1 Two component LuxR family transcriptional regulator [Erythrobacter dokdonensis DSW-74]
MSSGATRRLTDRQQAVMERIDRRVPIKVIALELGVSETRINQHIRALKDIYSAGSLGELVENYRASLQQVPAETDVAGDEDTGEVQDFADGDSLKTFSEAAYTKKQIPPFGGFDEASLRDDPGTLMMSDARILINQAPWLRPGEPKVVPGVLDGEHAVLFRLGAILGIASGILAAVVLTITAAVTLTEATAGKATVSVDSTQVAG